MSVADRILEYAKSLDAVCSEKKGVYTVTVLVAERKAFLSKKKLTYTARFRVDEENRRVKFTESLSESGMGLAGSCMDSAGFGFKAESYSTGAGKPREGGIKEQSNLFGKKYEYRFDFSRIRGEIEKIASSSGYAPVYQVTPVGL